MLHTEAQHSQVGALISRLTEWECHQSTGFIDIVKFFSYRAYVVAEAVKDKIISRIHTSKEEGWKKVSFTETVVTVLPI